MTVERGVIYDPLIAVAAKQAREIRQMAIEYGIDWTRRKLGRDFYYILRKPEVLYAYLGMPTDLRDECDPEKLWVLRNGAHLIPINKSDIVCKIYPAALTGSARNLVNWILTEAKQTKPA